MKWFSGLKRNVRIFITVISYLPFVIISTLADGDVENLSGFMYAVSLIFIILPIVITVFAVKADKKERRKLWLCNSETYKYCSVFRAGFDAIAEMNKLRAKNCATCILQQVA